MAFNGRGAMGGAMSGAATGASVGGPWGALAGGVLGGVTGGMTPEDPEIDPYYESRSRYYEDRLGRGGYDQGTADRYYNAEAQPINEGQSQSSRQTGASYGRRSLGQSGLALAAQNDILGRAAVQRRLAREASIMRATSDFRNQNLDALAALKAGFGMNLDAYRAAREGQGNDMAGLGNMSKLFSMIGSKDEGGGGYSNGGGW